VVPLVFQIGYVKVGDIMPDGKAGDGAGFHDKDALEDSDSVSE
jgi:hypothetical protein